LLLKMLQAMSMFFKLFGLLFNIDRRWREQLDGILEHLVFDLRTAVSSVLLFQKVV